jgi:hypothetical protein
VSERGINIQAHNVFQLAEDDDFNWQPISRTFLKEFVYVWLYSKKNLVNIKAQSKALSWPRFCGNFRRHCSV